VYNEDRPNDDDFDLWSPSAQREECHFGREVLSIPQPVAFPALTHTQVWYLRRKREANCKVGDQRATKEVQDERICRCTYSDFEWYAAAPIPDAKQLTRAQRIQPRPEPADGRVRAHPGRDAAPRRPGHVLSRRRGFVVRADGVR
jgi:hypothetical protein